MPGDSWRKSTAETECAEGRGEARGATGTWFTAEARSTTVGRRDPRTAPIVFARGRGPMRGRRRGGGRIRDRGRRFLMSPWSTGLRARVFWPGRRRPGSGRRGCVPRGVSGAPDARFSGGHALLVLQGARKLLLWFYLPRAGQAHCGRTRASGAASRRRADRQDRAPLGSQQHAGRVAREPRRESPPQGLAGTELRWVGPQAPLQTPLRSQTAATTPSSEAPGRSEGMNRE
jgi:hypothetical protein